MCGHGRILTQPRRAGDDWSGGIDPLKIRPDSAESQAAMPLFPEGDPPKAVLPDALTLAALVSNVTDTICGTKFVPADDMMRGQSICGRMVLLPIKGIRDISVVLSCDSSGGRALGAALRRCPPDQLTRAMIDDSIAELLNMVAGQIQTALEIDQPLGLPRTTSLSEISQKTGVGFSDSILLTSQGLGDLKLWIFETTAPVEPAPRATSGRTFRSLFQRVRSHL
jgi:Chemotaxis phosphatase CheX